MASGTALQTALVDCVNTANTPDSRLRGDAEGAQTWWAVVVLKVVGVALVTALCLQKTCLISACSLVEDHRLGGPSDSTFYAVLKDAKAVAPLPSLAAVADMAPVMALQ